MRTTLTIDDDVFVRLERERRKRGVSLKEIVNDVLLAGLDSLGRPRRKPTQFRTKGFNLGPGDPRRRRSDDPPKLDVSMRSG